MLKTLSIIFIYFLRLGFLPIWYLIRLIPRNKKIWIFGAWYGRRFSDNSKAIFVHVLKNHKDIRPIWLTRSLEISEKLKNIGYECYLVYSLRGVYYSLISKIAIISSGKMDINPYLINGIILIQLWHGAPMKKISRDDKYAYNKTLGTIKKVLFPFNYEYNQDYVITTSPAFSPHLSTAFDIPQKKILLTGYPRNDVFFNDQVHPLVIEWKEKFNNPKLILYLPTFRSIGYQVDLFKDFGFDEVKYHRFLAEKNILFVCKGHLFDNQIGIASDSDRIINLNAEEEVNPILKSTDMLITDYSGAYFDFLLTKRPIIFSAFDLNMYNNYNRELYFNYTDIVSGPIAKNWDQILEYIEEILSNDMYQDDRREKNDYFNNFKDSHSSQRVISKIKEIIKMC